MYLKNSPRYILIIAVLLTAFLGGCRQEAQSPIETNQPPPLEQTLASQSLPEYEVQLIQLPEQVNIPRAEFSGMTWAGDWLILLPQYPSRFNQQIFRIHKDTLADYLDQDVSDPITVEPVSLNTGGLEESITGFEGFEAICSEGQNAYLTIESSPDEMLGYVVRGTWSQDFSELTLQSDSLTPIEPQADLTNMSDESVLVFGRRVVTLYEANGLNVNPDPTAHLFDLDLQPEDQIPLTQLEYRVTDASQPDENGQFWVINYFFPGDTKLLPTEDPLTRLYNLNGTHAVSQVVEQIVPLQFSEQGIVLADTAPLRLELLPDNEARNWEGLVTFPGYGFLLVTDTFPETLLGFVAYPDL